jgi:hypothetical protein
MLQTGYRWLVSLNVERQRQWFFTSWKQIWTETHQVYVEEQCSKDDAVEIAKSRIHVDDIRSIVPICTVMQPIPRESEYEVFVTTRISSQIGIGSTKIVKKHKIMAINADLAVKRAIVQSQADQLTILEEASGKYGVRAPRVVETSANIY